MRVACVPLCVPREAGDWLLPVRNRDRTRRGLEDLTAHGLVNRTSHGKGSPDTWCLTAWAREHYAAVSDLSRFVGSSGEGDIKSDSAHSDISGTVRSNDEHAAAEGLEWR